MKKLLAAATFVALGAGTAGVGALNNVEWRGSDTLFELTRSILAVCPAAGAGAAGHLLYTGSGSGNGEKYMYDTSAFATPGACTTNVAGSDPRLDCQLYAPMSRTFAAGTSTARVCTFPSGSGTSATASRAEGINFALDAVNVYASDAHATTCNPGVADCDATTDPSTGLAYDGKSIAIQDLNGVPGVQCPYGAQNAACTTACGASGASGCYSFTIETANAAGDRATNTWRDVLRVIYAGLPVPASGVTATIADRDCNSDLRRTLVENWSNIFQNSCAGGTCGALKHAFRRDDESGTTDVFTALLGLPSIVFDPSLSPTDITPYCNAAQTNSTFVGSFCAVTKVNSNATLACVTDDDCQGQTAGNYPEAVCRGGVCGIDNEAPGCFPGPRPAPRASDTAAGKTWQTGWSLLPYTPDFQDNDPIRRACEGEYSRPSGTAADSAIPAGPAEEVCRARRSVVTGSGGAGKVDKEGTLGLVLTINPPPNTVAQDIAYPTKFCRQGSFAGAAAPRGKPAVHDPEMYIYPISGDCVATPTVCNTVPPNTEFVGCFDRNKGVGAADPRCAYAPAVERCPNGDVPSPLSASAGTCQVPHDGTRDFACMNPANNCPAVANDGLVVTPTGVTTLPTLSDYNRTNRIAPVRVGSVFTAGGTGSNGNGDCRAYNLQVRDHGGVLVNDPRGRPITGGFFRLHSSRTLLAGSDSSCPATASNPNGVCCQKDSATDQLACLVQASPCSLSFAGREGATVQLVTGTAAAPVVHNNTPLKLNSLASSLECVRNLTNTTGPFYQFSRKLFLNTMTGFEDPGALTEERALATCFSGANATGDGVAGQVGGITGGISALEGLITAKGFVTLSATPGTLPICVDFQQQNALSSAANGCNQALTATQCNDACVGNPTGIPNDDPLVANTKGDGSACP